MADRTGAVVGAALPRTRRGLASGLPPTVEGDGVPTDDVGRFDNIPALLRGAFRRRLAVFSPGRPAASCRALGEATGGRGLSGFLGGAIPDD